MSRIAEVRDGGAYRFVAAGQNGMQVTDGRRSLEYGTEKGVVIEDGWQVTEAIKEVEVTIVDSSVAEDVAKPDSKQLKMDLK